MKTRHLALLALTSAFLVLAPGCKTEKTRVCNHLESLMGEAGNSGGFSEIACEEQVRLTQDSCSNYEAIIDCWLAAESVPDFGRCRNQCEAPE